MTELIELVKTQTTRPKVKRQVKHARLTPEENKMLADLAALLEVSEAEAIRRSIHATHALLFPASK
jgi:hypothetical protein